jgi:outer membrane protein assembly factor BamA
VPFSLLLLLLVPFAQAEKVIVPAGGGEPIPVKQTIQDPVLTAAQARPKPEDGKFRSLVPLAGYNPTYRFYGGGGYFVNRVQDGKKVSELGVVAVIAQRRSTKFEINFHRILSEKFRMDLRNELSNGFESNYGRGNETRVEDRVDVLFWKDETEVYFPYSLSPRLSIGPGLEHRARRNRREARNYTHLEKDPVPNEEFVIAAGFKQELDYRDIPANPSLGWHQGLRVTTAYGYGGRIRKPSTTVDLDLDLFQYIIDRDLVLAHAIAGGIIFREPTYLNQFRLGGTDRLRGYFYNRFRGTRYYVEQSELRFPIYKAIGGTSFLEFGEVTDKHFSRAHVSYGMGILIGLPPDKISKIRIDYAIGRDQRGVFLDFGHAF